MHTTATLVVATAIFGVGLIQFVLALRQGDRRDDFADAQVSANYASAGEPGLQASRGSGAWLMAIAAALAAAAVAGLRFEFAISVVLVLVLLPTVIAFGARFVANRVGRRL